MTGVGHLLRLILRRDRWLLPLWVVITGLVPITYVESFANLYKTPAELQQYADVSATNAGFVALYGKVYGANLGAMSVWRGGFLPFVVGLFALLAVIRHTRTEEEAGRRELIGSTVVGRHANLAAALIAVGAATAVLGLVMALGMWSQGLSLTGSLAFGLQNAAAGWAYAGVGAVAAQLTSGAGAARGIAIGTLGLTYLLRIVGDLNTSIGWLSWLSPIGWVHRIHPYNGDRFWLAVLPAVLAALLAAVAVRLSGRRDLGAGLLPDRPGPASAAAGLASPLALAWRLHRGLLTGWVAGFAVLGLVLGGVTNGVGELVVENERIRQIMARIGGQTGIINAYLAAILGLYGLIAGGYAIQATLRLRAEEAAGRAEPVLATAVGRRQWLTSHALFAILGPTVVVLVAGFITGLTYGIASHNVGHQVRQTMAGSVIQLPAVWVLAAIAIALVGVLPRAAMAAWAALGVCVLILFVGGAVDGGQWLRDISPYTHIPRIPGGSFDAVPLVVLLLIATALAALGYLGIGRRDVPVA
jgi:ABC-2 type transport system permease protein